MQNDEELSANDSLVEYFYGLDIKQDLSEMTVEKFTGNEAKPITAPLNSTVSNCLKAAQARLRNQSWRVRNQRSKMPCNFEVRTFS